MTTTEQAREYAINALESQIATIAEAYLKGYADGVANGTEPVQQDTPNDLPPEYKNIEWNDFGLLPLILVK